MSFQYSALVLLFVIASCLAGCTGKQGEPGAVGTTSALTPAPPASSVSKTIAHGDLVRAASEGTLEKVRELLKNGADVNETIGEGDAQINPYMAAMVRGKNDVAEHLAKSGAKTDLSYRGYTASDFTAYISAGVSGQDDAANEEGSE